MGSGEVGRRTEPALRLISSWGMIRLKLARPALLVGRARGRVEVKGKRCARFCSASFPLPECAI
jgi:hypothetical protein